MNSTIPVPICITPVSFYFHAGLLYRNDLPMPLRMRSEKHRYTSEYSIKSTAFQYTNPLILFSAMNEAFSNQIRSLHIIKALHKPYSAMINKLYSIFSLSAYLPFARFSSSIRFCIYLYTVVIWDCFLYWLVFYVKLIPCFFKFSVSIAVKNGLFLFVPNSAYFYSKPPVPWIASPDLATTILSWLYWFLNIINFQFQLNPYNNSVIIPLYNRNESRMRFPDYCPLVLWKRVMPYEYNGSFNIVACDFFGIELHRRS